MYVLCTIYKEAAEVLADVWTDHVLDNHPVTAVASFDQDNADAFNATYPSEVWIRDHVYTLQYIQYTLQYIQHFRICSILYCKYGSAQTEDVAPLKDPTFHKC